MAVGRAMLPLVLVLINVLSSSAADLRSIAAQLVQPRKGILAADESPGTLGKRVGRRRGSTLPMRACAF